MQALTTGGRRGIAATFFALLLTTAACGSVQAPAGDLDSAVPGPPAVVQGPATSADAAERNGAKQGQGGGSANSEERLGDARNLPDPRIPDALP